MLKNALHDQMQHTSYKHSIYTKQNGMQDNYFQLGTALAVVQVTTFTR